MIEFCEVCKRESRVHDDNEIGAKFLQVSWTWMACSVPHHVYILLASHLFSITYEHPIHTAMANYCYSQGVLY